MHQRHTDTQPVGYPELLMVRPWGSLPARVYQPDLTAIQVRTAERKKNSR